MVDYGEVLYQRERRGGLPAVLQATAIIDNLPIEVVDVGRGLTFVAALSAREPVAVVTGDPEFAALEGQIRVEWLPK